MLKLIWYSVIGMDIGHALTYTHINRMYSRFF